MHYQRRIVDDLLDELFPELSAIALEGAKGVGKTATATQRATTVLSLNDPSQFAAVEGNWDLVTQVEAPVLVDEWQLVPQVWDRVRRAVDENPAGGRFLLAGSAGVDPGVRIHSGAGRIISMTMRPMSIFERGVESPTVSLSDVLAGGQPAVTGRTALNTPDYVDEILRSGFPGIRDLPERARGLQLDSYVGRIIEREMPENQIIVRRPNALRSWLSAYAAATSTNASYGAILDAATPGETDKPARQTVSIYREQLQRLYLLDPIEAWIPALSPLSRLTQGPKHHLVDPALAARLVGVGRSALMRGGGERVAHATGTWLGALFESLATQSIRIYAEAVGAQVGHLRTKGGDHEIDLIVEAEDRSCVAIEVKLADSVQDRDARHLNWLQEQLGDRLVDRLMITTGSLAYRRRDGVAVVPLALLGP